MSESVIIRICFEDKGSDRFMSNSFATALSRGVSAKFKLTLILEYKAADGFSSTAIKFSESVSSLLSEFLVPPSLYLQHVS